MKQIRLATTEDSQDISKLRIGEFNRAKDFALLIPQRLKWCRTDESNHVLGIWNKKNQVVATLRIMPVNDREKAAAVIEADVPDSVGFPAYVFNSAATRKDYRKKGLNQLLRYYAISSAKASGILNLLSPVYQSAPRINFMKELGYACNEMTRSWQTKLAPKSPRMLCVLEADKFSRALDIIRRSIPELLAEYPWQGPTI